MTETFFAGCLHFGHRNIIKFTNDQGERIRPFDSIEEHDETIIANWNAMVKPHDKVYVLGDIAMNRKAIPTMARLNGDLVLVKGNHDIFQLKDYTPYFRDIRAYVVMPGENLIFSHIPIHPESIRPKNVNVHAHIHQQTVLDANGKPDPRYMCVCMEHTNFAPISLNTIKKKIWERNLET